MAELVYREGRLETLPSHVDIHGRVTWCLFETPQHELKEADRYVVEWEAKGWKLIREMPEGPTSQATPQVARDNVSPTASSPRQGGQESATARAGGRIRR